MVDAFSKFLLYSSFDSLLPCKYKTNIYDCVYKYILVTAIVYNYTHAHARVLPFAPHWHDQLRSLDYDLVGILFKEKINSKTNIVGDLPT